jgi:hypothetical protein
VGHDYATDTNGTASGKFTWNLHIPAHGKYTVYAAYPAVSGATYTITYSNSSGGTATATASTDQTQNTSPDANGKTVWVALGTWAFSQSQSGQQVSVAGKSGATVAADAVRVVRDNSTDQNTATNTYTYSYDPNGNQTGIAVTATPTPQVASYAMTYNGIDQLTNAEEDNAAGTAVHTPSYGYDPAGNLASREIRTDRTASTAEKYRSPSTATCPAKTSWYFTSQGDLQASWTLQWPATNRAPSSFDGIIDGGTSPFAAAPGHLPGGHTVQR